MPTEVEHTPSAVESLFKDAPENGKAMLKGALKGLPLEKIEGLPIGAYWGAIVTAGQGLQNLVKAYRTRREENGTGCYAYSDEQRNQGIFQLAQAGILAGVSGLTALIAAHVSPPEARLVREIGSYIKEPLSTGLELHLHVCAKRMEEAAKHMKEASKQGRAYCIEGAVGPACHYPRRDFGQPFFGTFFRGSTHGHER